MQPFIVKLFGLPTGKREFAWQADREFFARFGNKDILDADIRVEAELVNHGATIDVACDIEGSVTVPCDRCLDDLVIPVETSFEETCVPEDEELDLSQDVYDYVCTSLPLQRVHQDGECNSETVKYLCK